MVKKLGVLVLALFVILFVSFVSATSIEPVKQGENATLYQTCNNCTYCNITKVTNPNGTILLSNEEFIENPATYYYYILNASNTTTLGSHKYCYDCGNSAESETGCIDFEVTPNGFATDLSKAWVNIIVLIFFIGLIITIHTLVKKIDFKRWNDGILQKYIDRNFIKVALSGIFFNIMNNVYIIYYLLGLPIFLILMDLVYIYNISAVITIMNVIFYIYLIGIIIVGLIFFSYIQEWVVMMMDLVKDMDWGVEA